MGFSTSWWVIVYQIIVVSTQLLNHFHLLESPHLPIKAHHNIIQSNMALQYCFVFVLISMSIKSNIFPWYDLLMESDNVLRIDQEKKENLWFNGWWWRTHKLSIRAEKDKLSGNVGIVPLCGKKSFFFRGRKQNFINVWTNYCFYASFVNFNDDGGWVAIVWEFIIMMS